VRLEMPSRRSCAPGRPCLFRSATCSVNMLRSRRPSDHVRCDC
jgi:hypothetical protein